MAIATEYQRSRTINVRKFYDELYSFVSERDQPVRIMGIESALLPALNAYRYLNIKGVLNLGIFSVGISRRHGSIKEEDRKILERDLSRYSGFLDGSLLLAVDDIAMNGKTKEIIDMEVEKYFGPVHGIRDYRFCAVATSVDSEGRPYADIYGAVIRDPIKRDRVLPVPLHIKPVLNSDLVPIIENNPRVLEVLKDLTDDVIGSYATFIQRIKNTRPNRKTGTTEDALSKAISSAYR